MLMGEVPRPILHPLPVEELEQFLPIDFPSRKDSFLHQKK
jgi:hypothetical protein